MDEKVDFMKICISLGEKALSRSNPPVGSIIVHHGKVIGEGIESARSTGDVTNHAEILAIKDVINKGFKDLLSTSTLYSTHEPCIMCSYSIRHYKIPEIIYSLSVADVGGASSKLNVLTSTDVSKWGDIPKIEVGLLAQKCEDLNGEFQKIISKKS